MKPGILSFTAQLRCGVPTKTNLETELWSQTVRGPLRVQELKALPSLTTF